MRTIFNILSFLLLNALSKNAECYRILGLFPLTVRSHDIFCQSVVKALAKNGHQVDVLITRELENPPDNYTVILNLNKFIPFIITDLKLEKLHSTYSSDAIKFVSHQLGNQICEHMANVKMQQVFQKIKNGPKYDLFVIEALGINCFLGLAHSLNIPFITLSPQSLYPWVEDAIGNPSSVATHPTILSTTTEINSFWDRLQNLIKRIIMKIKYYHITDQQTNIMRKYISSDLPNVHELAKESILTLVNTHFSFNGIRPLTPALVEVGGLHILQDEAKFTNELQKWMDESKHGVVYFSLGTIILIESLPKDTILAFYSVIKKLSPIRFLIRIKNSKHLLPGAPDNLKTMPWIPQIPVLRHKNTKAFITHCGLLSTLEALYFGVPVIGIPIVADQFINIHNLIKRNMGIRLDIDKISEKTLFDALAAILTNSSYRESARKASNIFKDRPMDAEKTAVYWIEYVIRNGEILKSPAVNLHWMQNELLDIYGFLVFLVTFILLVLTKILKVLIKSKGENKCDDENKKKDS